MRGYRYALVIVFTWVLGAGSAQADSQKARELDWSVRLLRQFRAEPLRAAIDDMTSSFRSAYPRARDYQRQLEDLDRQRQSLLAHFDADNLDTQQTTVRLAHAIDQLRRDALLSNPLLDFDRLLLVRRKYQLPPNRASGGKPRSPRPRPWQYSESLEGRALGLPVNHNSIFSIRRAGYDNQIAVLSPVRPDGQLTTLFRPQEDVFVGEVDLDFDAGHLLFTMPEDDLWQVFELAVDGTQLTRLTPNDDHDVDNYDACYVPDGRIVFCSTASYQAVPCWNGLHNVGSLYLLDRRLGRIRQLTFDQDDDNYPSVLNTGQVLYTRWEYANIPHFFGRLLFAMNPDGTGQQSLYGTNSYWPNAVYFARAVPGHATKIAAIVSGHHGDFRMGNLVILDPAKGRERNQGLVFRMPNNWSQHFDRQNRYPDGVDQPLGYDKQDEPILRDRLTSLDWPKFLHPFPLNEHYLLVSAKVSPQANWGIYLVDTFGNMTLIRGQDGEALLEPIPLRPTPRPPAIADRVDLTQQVGVVYLQHVYAGPGLAGVPRRTVKSLRVIAYEFGYRGLTGFDKIGIDGPWDVMRILGTVPVDADGSAAFRAPANTPITVQPLDERGRALQLMRSWFTLMPGESRSCVGCHESYNTGPTLDQTMALAREPTEITPWYGPARGFDFEREVQPVLDRYCVSCHDGRQTAVGGRSQPDLRRLALRPDYKGILTNVPNWYNADHLQVEWSGELMRIGKRKHVPIRFTPAYEALIEYVRRTGPEGDYHLLEPTEYYADTSLLIQILEKGHHGVQLDTEALDRLVTWIDLNVPCHGTWHEALPIPFNGAERKRALATRYAGWSRDPETIPVQPRKPVRPIHPEKVQSEQGDTWAPGWPFDCFEAQLRQQAAGSQTRRTIQLGQGLTMELALVPAGEFIMGNAYDGSPDEWPLTRVRIDRPFWMGTCEVSNEQFRLFDPSHDSRFVRAQKMNVHSRGYPLNEPRQPVVRVTWQQAMGFCGWFSQRTGERCTLPTEAQWEYACRAGSRLPMWWGWFNESFAERANLADRTIRNLTKWDFSPLNQIYDGWMPFVPTFDDGAMVTAEVGRYAANPWGLHDMHGNAAEWTRTLYRSYPYDPKDGRESPTATGNRVVRGGAWCDLPYYATASYRFAYPPWRKVHHVGFRVVVPAN